MLGLRRNYSGRQLILNLVVFWFRAELKTTIAKSPFGSPVQASNSSNQTDKKSFRGTMASQANGMNGAHASEAEMSHLTMRNQPMDVREPSGYTNGTTSSSKYGLDRMSIQRKYSQQENIFY